MVTYFPLLTQIFGGLGFSAVFLWAARFLYLYLQNIKQVERIRGFEANIAVLRMLLKSKIKKQINSIEGQFQSDQVFLAIIRPHFETVCKIDFSYHQDYQRLIKTFCLAFQVIDTEMKKRVPSLFKDEDRNAAMLSESERQVRLFAKYAGSLVNLMRDTVTTTVDLKMSIDNYKETSSFKSNFHAPKLITIENFEKLCELANQQQTVAELEKLKAA